MLTNGQQARVAVIISLATAPFSRAIRINRIVHDPEGRIYVEIAERHRLTRRGYVEILPDGELVPEQRVGTHAADLETIVDVGTRAQEAQLLAAVGYRIDGGGSGSRRVTRWSGGVGEYVGYVMYTDAWYAFRSGAVKTVEAVGKAETPEAAALILTGWDDAFDPGQVSIERHRSSVTQGEVSLYYEGGLLGRYGDDVRIITDREVLLGLPAPVLDYWPREEISEGDGRQVVGGFAGLPDSAWVAAAQREFDARRQRESRRTAAVLRCTELHVCNE